MKKFCIILLVSLVAMMSNNVVAQNYEQLAHSAFNQGDYNTCIKYCKIYYAEKGTHLSPLENNANNCAEYLRQAESYYNSGNYSEAERYYRMILSLNPYDSKVSEKVNRMYPWMNECYILPIDGDNFLAIQKPYNSQPQVTCKSAQSAAESSRLGGLSDWRLPTDSELEAILSKMDVSLFPFYRYWSGSAYAEIMVEVKQEVKYRDRNSGRTWSEWKTNKVPRVTGAYYLKDGRKVNIQYSSETANYLIVRKYSKNAPLSNSLNRTYSASSTTVIK